VPHSQEKFDELHVIIHEIAISCKSMHDDALNRNCASCSSSSLSSPNTKSRFAINARHSTAWRITQTLTPFLSKMQYRSVQACTMPVAYAEGEATDPIWCWPISGPFCFPFNSCSEWSKGRD